MFTVKDNSTLELVTVYGVTTAWEQTLFLIWGPDGWDWADADRFSPWRGPE